MATVIVPKGKVQVGVFDTVATGATGAIGIFSIDKDVEALMHPEPLDLIII